ncbi:MAG: hypothetical protein AB8H86_10270 [Polyangiales bacterium]
MKVEDSTTRLAESAGVIVDRCSCGNSFYLHIGGVALRLPQSALEELYETLGEALVRQAIASERSILDANSMLEN